jgi:hypothetical protein
MRALVKLALGLSLLFALTLGALRLGASPTHPELLASDCRLPCWEGLQPGSTARAEAVTQLNAGGWLEVSDCRTSADASDSCGGLFWHNGAAPNPKAYIYVDQDQVYQITLDQPGLLLGDVWLAFGDPEHSVYDIPYDPATHRVSVFYASFWFGAVNTRVSLPCPTSFASVFNRPISTLILGQRLTSPNDPAGEISELRRAFHEVCSR